MAQSEPWTWFAWSGPARLAATQAPLPRHPFRDPLPAAAAAEPAAAKLAAKPCTGPPGPSLPSAAPCVAARDLAATQTAFGWGAEDVAIHIADVARTGNCGEGCAAGCVAVVVVSTTACHSKASPLRARYGQVLSLVLDLHHLIVLALLLLLLLPGVEATFSMGDDAPLAALSSRPHVPFDYLRQLFAQVKKLE